jgi:hypothetical protein
MPLDGKTVLPGDFLLKLFYARVLEFDDLPTADADQVIVMLIQVTGFIACLAISEMALLGDAAFSKQLQGPVNGGITDPGVFTAQAQVKFFGGEVGTDTQKLLENNFPLAGRLQAPVEHERPEFVFCLCAAHRSIQLKTDFNLI